ncbi:glycosyltransferase family 87 protein [Histidinibacterium lentulum]|uniref:DUF2029 domain-containing protein n=1 Tax=Histidinibacterium lentulum TaxID=2480588 RepID=A0A3N2QUV2_9RHOB|nr:glycosyltransferase family 87 protein [Histidinibacterium lentulum]ROT99008.1 DUF2029 domain-containing protein [Histidinibacterium lentulum]
MTHPPWYTPLIFLSFAAFSWLYFAGDPSPDLRATWIAGHFYSLGAPSQIYAGNEGYFTMRALESWDDWSAAEGLEGVNYPFVYPPLWAALAGALTQVMPYWLFKGIAAFLNPLLMVGMVWLAARCVDDREVSVQMMTFLGGLVVVFTLPGIVALQQNQPHILVSFLMVLAVERARAGAMAAAGAALGFAAALKLFPALLVVVWIASGRWRPVGWFALFGGGLGALSVALAGWPLHEAFLSEIDAIRASIIVTGFNYGLDALMAWNLRLQDLVDITHAEGGWKMLEKPALWQMLSMVALATILTFAFTAARLARRAGRDPDILIWPVLFIALAFVSPLAWGYYYLPALAFLPHLLDRFGLRRGGVMFALIAAPLTPHAFTLLIALVPSPFDPAVMGSLTVLAMAGLFALAIRHRRDAAGGPLRASPVSL